MDETNRAQGRDVEATIAAEAYSTRCIYVRDDLIANLDAIVATRKRAGQKRLRRSHVIEEAIELWLAINSQKSDYRISDRELAEVPA